MTVPALPLMKVFAPVTTRPLVNVAVPVTVKVTRKFKPGKYRAVLSFPGFNSFPASIFMGDTGSLGLGGAIAAMAVMTKTEVLLIIIGGIFVIEALSVLIQVFSFQTFRKRVFLMAPIHHHFELQGWSETKIILRFWIVAAACAAIGFTVYQASIK